MGNGIELAKAYVQIVPSAEGIQGKITEVLGGESSKAGDAAGQLLGKKLVGAVAKVISAAGIGKIWPKALPLAVLYSRAWAAWKHCSKTVPTR